ncbi:hypothetical protein JNK13_09710 [bacterium]|nr:hypothetical protein [bacterium]
MPDEALTKPGTLHDARTGFNDLKPAPQFTVESNLVYWLLALCVPLFLAWIKHVRGKTLANHKLALATQSFADTLRELLQNLKSNKLAATAASSQLSLALRSLFSAAGLGVVEALTTAEFKTRILESKQISRLNNAERISTELKALHQELCKLEHYSFSGEVISPSVVTDSIQNALDRGELLRQTALDFNQRGGK